MNHSLDKLQKVRSLREQLAQCDLTQGRRRLDQADQELSRKRMDLKHLRLIKSKLEALLFSEIDHTEMTLYEFEVYRGRIRDLCAEEQNFLERVRQAEIQKDSTCAEVDRLSAALQKRCRESTKLKEFCTAWNTTVEEEKKWWEQEEMEEMVANRFSRNDILKV
jgi:hypothetical protein